MNVEIGTEAAQFPEKEYIYGISLAVQSQIPCILRIGTSNTPLFFSNLLFVK
jgi:hypothetical protein